MHKHYISPNLNVNGGFRYFQYSQWSIRSKKDRLIMFFKNDFCCCFWHKKRFFSSFSASDSTYTLGVPATSRILTGDSQKLSFSILRKVPFLIFWSDKPPRRTNSAHAACSRAGTWAAWADVVRRQCVSCVDKIYIFEILMKNC